MHLKTQLASSHYSKSPAQLIQPKQSLSGFPQKHLNVVREFRKIDMLMGSGPFPSTFQRYSTHFESLTNQEDFFSSNCFLLLWPVSLSRSCPSVVGMRFGQRR
jgi:hypothetical protein